METTKNPLIVGPMDPDNTAELTARYGVGNNALKLLQGQADNQPPELMAALTMPPDVDRSQALVLDEVMRKSGDLLSRDGCQLRSAYVRGKDPWSQVVTITYLVPSGRVGKALLGPFSEFPKSMEAFERVRSAKMGLGSYADGLANPGDTPPAASPEAEQLRKLVEEMQQELGRLRNPEPVEGYRSLNAQEAAMAVYEMDASALDRVVAYETAAGAGQDGGPRSTVIKAVGKRREDLAEQATDLAALRAARESGSDPLAPATPPTT